MRVGEGIHAVRVLSFYILLEATKNAWSGLSFYFLSTVMAGGHYWDICQR